jgi:transcription elongation factor
MNRTRRRQLQPGDRVRVTRGWIQTVGKRGTVRAVSPEIVTVHYDGDPDWMTAAHLGDDLEPADDR